MSHINSPPVPPPPPPCPTNKKLTLSPQSLNTSQLTKINEKELDITVKRFLSKEEKIFFMCNSELTPQLQDGPKCGLVALSIASSGSENFVNVQDIFQTAVSFGFTKQGEMFNTNSLAFLAEKCCGFRTRIINGGLKTHILCIMKSLMKKCLLLVPYDADFNHSPCCKQGSKAHWAVISGFLVVEPTDGEESDFLIINSLNAAPCDCPDTNDDILDLSLETSIEKGKILIGLQGKSGHVGLWSFHQMADSNENLVSFSTARNPDCYVLPEGSLEEGLKGKAIVLDTS